MDVTDLRTRTYLINDKGITRFSVLRYPLDNVVIIHSKLDTTSFAVMLH